MDFVDSRVVRAKYVVRWSLVKWVLRLILLNISISEAVADDGLWGDIKREGGLERGSNRSGLTCKCKVMNLWIKIRSFCCEFEPHWLSVTGVKEVSV